MRRAILSALAALLLGLAVAGTISPALFGLGPRIGIRLGFWPNTILLAGGTVVAFLATRAEPASASGATDAGR